MYGAVEKSRHDWVIMCARVRREAAVLIRYLFTPEEEAAMYAEEDEIARCQEHAKARVWYLLGRTPPQPPI